MQPLVLLFTKILVTEWFWLLNKPSCDCWHLALALPKYRGRIYGLSMHSSMNLSYISLLAIVTISLKGRERENKLNIF